jgi:hypothetical protein
VTSRSATTLAACVLFLYGLVEFLVQDRITVNAGLGWDGERYAELARSLAFEDARLEPFRYRILMPLIVHFLPVASLVAERFFVLNMVFSYAALLLLFRILLRSFPGMLRSVFLVWVVVATAELSPIRMTFFYPAMTDPFHILAIIVLLDCATRIDGTSNARAVSVTIFFTFLLGSLNRENFFLYFPLVAPPLRRFGGTLLVSASRRAWAPIGVAAVASLLGLWIQGLLVHANVFSTRGGAYFDQLRAYPFPSVCAAVFLVYGALLLLVASPALLVPAHRDSCGTAGRLWVTVGIVFVTALGGGVNIERFLYWGMPVLAWLAVPHVERHFVERRYLSLTVALATHVAFQKVFFRIHSSGVGTRGLPRDAGASYSLVETLTGEGPVLFHWVYFAQPAMINTVAITASLIIAIKLVLDARTALRFETGGPR